MSKDVRLDDVCQHRCECKHGRVKYCPKCRVVHCLDCKQEWAERSYVWYQPWTYTYTSAVSPTRMLQGTTTTGTALVQKSEQGQQVCSHT